MADGTETAALRQARSWINAVVVTHSGVLSEGFRREAGEALAAIDRVLAPTRAVRLEEMTGNIVWGKPMANEPAGWADDPCVWLIFFEDTEVRPEIFSGCGATEAAHKRFDQVRTGYNCRLFVMVTKG